MTRFVAILATCLLAGCGFVSFEDVSNDPAYSAYAGTEYRTTSDMIVHRVSMDGNHGPSPGIYEIVQPPGFDGPEVISRTRFPEGSTLNVLTIQRCKDCYLDAEPRVHATVRVTSTTRFDDLEVRANLHLLSSHMQTLDTMIAHGGPMSTLRDCVATHGFQRRHRATLADTTTVMASTSTRSQHHRMCSST